MDTATPDHSGHRHHWLIAEPNGPHSAGVCKHCDLRRDFRNWLPDMDFLNNEGSGNLAAAGRGWKSRGARLRSRVSGSNA